VVFGEMVRGHRHRLGITQEELAEAAGLSVRSIGKIEAGKIDIPRPTTVRLLADAIGLTGNERDGFCRAAVGTGRVRAAGGRIPAQLPADIAGFTGREAHLAQLDGLLPSGTDRTTAVVISAIQGSAGIGKTALAVHWAHRVADRFPDGQLYVNLRGFDPRERPIAPAVAVRYFLDALGVPPGQVPACEEAQYGMYRSILASRRMLVILDNARAAEQVRPLIPGSRGCMVVVTSRHSLSGLVATEAAWPMVVDLLSPAEARNLLAARLGRDRVAAQPQAVDEIITRCVGLPLGLVIVAAQAAAHPDFPLAAIAEQLDRAQRRLDAFAGDDPATDLRAVFSWSYRTLTAGAARLFRRLGMHLGPDVAVPAAASIAGIHDVQVRTLLAELARAHLVNEHVPGRYTFHDLLRAYAAELAHANDTEEERRATLHRMFDHYLHTAHTAGRLLYPSRDPIIPAPAQAGVSPEDLADYEQACAWFAAEHAVLIAAVRHAAATGFDTHSWQLARTLSDFLARRGHWPDQAAVQHTALEAALRTADPLAQANAHRDLADAYARLGRYDDAHPHLRQALALFDRLGDHTGQAHTHIALNWILDRQSRHKEALHHATQALDLYRATGYWAGQAIALNNLGRLFSQLGDHHKALTYCGQALALHQEAGDRSGQAHAWDSLGHAHHHLGHHRHAIDCYQHALDLFRKIGDRYNEAATLTNFGDTYHAAARHAARAAWRDAAAIFRDLDHPDLDQVRARLQS
jgi:tetratricopeptide (TPR) repeat protein/transcriptional regulator with XRE-family HTH domain